MNFIEVLQRRSDIFITLGIVAILGVMLVPLPPLLLDVFLSVSIAVSIVILVTAVYVQKPLDFSVFPSILLIATLYRLSLNIAATRLILLNGNEGIDAAGHVIMAFGSFVVGGNYAVGFIMFLILVVINFVVITKGAGRIAEVSARFTLDAMPGKQMAIDADLNAGLINESEARRRRFVIAQEADFYGAMDGASKFVRGDAVAGLVITGINIVGGLMIGILQHNMPVSAAASTFTILTIGDGLVAQIPAILVSTAAGIVMTRAGVESDLSRDITRQLLINPKAMFTASGILFIFGLIPGLPHIPFLFISAVIGGIAYALHKSPVEQDVEEKPDIPHEEPRIETYIEIDPLTLEIGYGLIPLVEGEKGEFLGKVKAMRRQVASEIGFVVPPLHIKDNLQLRPHEYSFLIRGVEISRGELMAGHYLAVVSEGAEAVKGIPTKEPAFGLPAYWIEEQDVESTQASGHMVVDHATTMATHLTELIKRHAWEMLTRVEVQGLLDNVAKSYPKLVDELVPSHLTLGGVQRVLQNLLKERVPINDLVAILETLIDYAPATKDTEMLTEHVRQALSRYITKQYVLQDGSLPVFTLDPKIEIDILQTVDAGGAVSPDFVSRLIRGLENAISKDKLKGIQPVLLCSVQVRRFIRRIVEKFMPSVVVISIAEAASAAKLYTMGMVKYEN